MRVIITRSLCRKQQRCDGGCGRLVQVNECLSYVGPLTGHKACEGDMLDAVEAANMRRSAYQKGLPVPPC